MALEFNASNETYVDCGNDSSLDLYSKHTIVVRVSLSSISTAEFKAIVCKRLYSSIWQGYGIWVCKDSGEFRFWISDAGGYVDSNISPELGRIYTAIQIYDGTYVKGWVDNQYQGSAEITAISTADVCLNIGRDSGGGNHINGVVHEVSLYNGCITDTEREIITFSQGSDNIVDGLVGWWRFDEKPEGESATGTNSIIDLSGHGNHGTPTNNPIYRSGNLRIIKPPIIR